MLSVASLHASFHTDTTLSQEMAESLLPPASRAVAFRAAGSSLSLPVSCISQEIPRMISPPPLSPLHTEFQLLHEDSAGWESRGSVSTDTPPVVGHPLITVTINPLEQDEVTFIPPSPPLEENGAKDFFTERHLSIGSCGSLNEEEDRMLGSRLRANNSFRRVSDISHIKQLRREVPGLSHLASEFYEVTTADPDNISLDSIHIRVLDRCVTKFQPPDRSATTSRWFVIITTGLTLLSFTYIFWFKNFSSLSSSGTH